MFDEVGTVYRTEDEGTLFGGEERRRFLLLLCVGLTPSEEEAAS
jgi:hypothetical protein